MRKRFVTRTIKSTTATVFVVDKVKKETRERTVTVPGFYSSNNDKKLCKAIDVALEGTNCQRVSVTNRVESKEIYGMPEEQFIQQAQRMPDRKIKSEKEEEEQ